VSTQQFVCSQQHKDTEELGYCWDDPASCYSIWIFTVECGPVCGVVPLFNTLLLSNIVSFKKTEFFGLHYLSLTVWV